MNSQNSVAASSCDIEAITVFPQIRRAVAEGLIEPNFLGAEELDKVEAQPRGTELASFREREPLFQDIARETSWWSGFSKSEGSDHLDSVIDSFEPYMAPPKTGRNEPCPCGSGKKYKKCHGVTV